MELTISVKSDSQDQNSFENLFCLKKENKDLIWFLMFIEICFIKNAASFRQIVDLEYTSYSQNICGLIFDEHLSLKYHQQYV